LEHDLFETTVDLAVGYTLDLALNFQPKLDVSFLFYFYIHFCLFISGLLIGLDNFSCNLSDNAPVSHLTIYILKLTRIRLSHITTRRRRRGVLLRLVVLMLTGMAVLSRQVGVVEVPLQVSLTPFRFGVHCY
jgi:hypothetical protein